MGVKRRRRTASGGGANDSNSSTLSAPGDKSYKICSVLGGLDVTRFVSRDARSVFAGAIDDVELIREFIGETAASGGVGRSMTLRDLNRTLDATGRGMVSVGRSADSADAAAQTSISAATTTVGAGLGYVDDRPDRRKEIYVSLGGELAKGDKASRRDVEAQLAMVQAAGLIFPWLVDRRSKSEYWFVSHQNGWSEGPEKEPFRFDSLYTAAWIGSKGEAWVYYPPFNLKAGGTPFTLGDALGADVNCSDCPFTSPNFPDNNPTRRAFLTSPYPDVAQTGLSMITALAPVYFNGTFLNRTYNDEYIASTGLDIEVAAISSMLEVVNGRLTKGSFGLLVDLDLNVIVISQSVVEMIYPPFTGFEEQRVTYDVSDGSILDDRRNQTYLVSDTLVQGLEQLESADWTSLKVSLLEIERGERDFMTLDITLTGKKYAQKHYVMFERWKYVADWALVILAPVDEVTDAISVGFNHAHSHVNKTHNQTASSGIVLEGERGYTVSGNTSIMNNGTLDVTLSPHRPPTWMTVKTSLTSGEVLKSGESMPIYFDIHTEMLELGASSALLSFSLRDDSYPDCFYTEELSLSVTVRVLPRNCARITGDRLRGPDSSGLHCICKENILDFGGHCYSYGTVLPLILLPLVFIAFMLVNAYVERKRRQADSVWEVKSSELIYGDPIEIAGRGTFGLVLIAEYRGTAVAVKRVVPPRTRVCKGTGKGMGSTANNTPQRRSSLLNTIIGNPATRRASLPNFITSKSKKENGASKADKGYGSLSDIRFDFDSDDDASTSSGNTDEEKANRHGNGNSSIVRNEESAPLNNKRRRRSTGPSRRRPSLGMMAGYGRNSLPNAFASGKVRRGSQISTSSSKLLSLPENMETTKKHDPGQPGHNSVLSFGTSSSSTDILFSQGLVSRSGGFFNFRRSKHNDLKAQFIEEMRHLSKLRHPCITTVMGAVISRSEEPLLVMEYMDHGSLYDLLHNSTMIFDGEIVLPILRDIAQGLRFLHAADPHIIHGDLKAANCLVDAKFRAKVADFGFSVKKDIKKSAGLATGTPYFMSPELLRNESDNTAESDVYAFGIILYEVFSRKDPYEGEKYEEVIRAVADPEVNKRPPIPPSMPAEVTALLYSPALEAEPESRPSFQEISAFLKRFQADNVDPGQQIKHTRRLSNDDASRRLLDEIFPPHIAEALRDGRKVEPEHFDCVTIFFSDIVGYTSLSAEMPPMKVSNMLDRLYTRFDDLSKQRGVHKLETIGDAWMGVTNLYAASPEDHVKRIARFSMDAIQAAGKTLIDIEDPAMGFVQIRVGFHSGSVLTNVVGRRLPKFSVFGDTVNTASRMESNSLPGRIHCSERSAKLLRVQAPEMSVICRGEIEVKGKGIMTTFWVGEDSSEAQSYVLEEENVVEYTGALKD